MRYVLLLTIALLAGCEKPTPTQKAADQAFEQAQTRLLIHCRGKYDLKELRATYKRLRTEQPDSALSWAVRLSVGAGVGECPE